jgi:hypothetical protein
MAYRLRIGMLAQRHIDDFAVYLGDDSERFAIEQIDRLNRILSVNIGEAPNTWSYFPFTGAPYRGYLPAVMAGLFRPSTSRLLQRHEDRLYSRSLRTRSRGAGYAQSDRENAERRQSLLSRKRVVKSGAP